MADKGFNLKVIVPTEDGIKISSKPAEESPYILMYNVSNRSYQLAGKFKARDLLKESQDIITSLNKIIEHENVDLLLGQFSNQTLNCKFFKADFIDINQLLHSLIEKIDQKKELFQ